MSTTVREIYEAFKSMGAEDDRAMRAAFSLSGPEGELSTVKADIANIKSDIGSIKSELTTLAVKAAETRGDIKLLTWMVGLIILTTVTPLLARAFGH